MWLFFVLTVHTKFLSRVVNRVSSRPGKIHAFKGLSDLHSGNEPGIEISGENPKCRLWVRKCRFPLSVCSLGLLVFGFHWVELGEPGYAHLRGQRAPWDGLPRDTTGGYLWVFLSMAFVLSLICAPHF